MLIQTVLSALLTMSISGVGPHGATLLGRISDGSTPVSGAIVTISNRGFVQSATTDENGQFTFEPVPLGRSNFRASAKGYAVFECPVVVRGGDSRRNRISITALVPEDKQTVSVAELMRRKAPSIVPKGDRGQDANGQESLR